MIAHKQTLGDTVEKLIHDLYELDVSIEGKFTVQKARDHNAILKRLAALPDWDSVPELHYAVKHRPDHVCRLYMLGSELRYRFIHVRTGHYTPAPAVLEVA